MPPRPAADCGLGGDLRVDTRVHGSTIIVEVVGELDLATVDLLRVVLDGVQARRPQRVELDLSGVTFLEMHVLATLMATRRRLAARRAELAVRDASRLVRRALALTGLDRVIECPDAPAGPAAVPSPRTDGRPALAPAEPGARFRPPHRWSSPGRRLRGRQQ